MMFKVTYSERGSDNRLKEEATYIMFRQYMQRCAGMHCIFDCVLFTCACVFSDVTDEINSKCE